MAIDGEVGRTLLIAVGTAALVLLVLAVGVHVPTGSSGPPPTVRGVTMVEPVDGGGRLWPYTSRSTSYGTRTLPINVIVEGEHETVRREFRRRVTVSYPNETRSGETANESDPAIRIVDGELVWSPAHGATRYTYVHSPSGESAWLGQHYQLFDGDYFGVRHHVRAYESPFADWTAMQGHREYWDWFRLRHTVTSTGATQSVVDDQFVEDGRVESRRIVSLANGRHRFGDGWATLIEFGAAAGLLSLAAGRRWVESAVSRTRTVLTADRIAEFVPAVGLAAAVGVTYLAVRAGGIVLEAHLSGVPPKVIAGGLYPFVAIGLPVVAYVVGRHAGPERAFVAGSVGVAAAFVVESNVLGLTAVPVDLALHRVAVALALGIVAACGALAADDHDGWQTMLALGVGGWLVALGLSLFGLL